METIEQLGKGLYQVAIQYKPKPRAHQALEFYCEGLADNPVHAYKLALNELYLNTGCRTPKIIDNIITLIIPTPEYFIHGGAFIYGQYPLHSYSQWQIAHRTH